MEILLKNKSQEGRQLRLTGAILAGGRSRRLGQDKARLLLAGQPLALRVAASLAPFADELWLITNHPLAHLGLGLPILTDLVPDQGPLGGLRTALFLSRTPWVLAASVDNPFLSSELLAPMVDRAGKTRRAAVVYGSEGRLEPFPGLYHVRLFERLTAYLMKSLQVRPFLEQLRPEVLPIAACPGPAPSARGFFNLNTPEDHRRAEAWLTQNPL